MRHLAIVGAAILVGTALVAAFTTFRIWDQGARDEARTADAIVVLGAAQYNGTPSQIYEARLDHAVDLYEAGVAPVLVVTGGKAEGDLTPEAAAGRAHARVARGRRPADGRGGALERGLRERSVAPAARAPDRHGRGNRRLGLADG